MREVVVHMFQVAIPQGERDQQPDGLTFKVASLVAEVSETVGVGRDNAPLRIGNKKHVGVTGEQRLEKRRRRLCSLQFFRDPSRFYDCCQLCEPPFGESVAGRFPA